MEPLIFKTCSFVLLCVFLRLGVVNGACEFPDFTQNERVAGVISPWITMRKYRAENMYDYEEEQQIRVTGGKMTFHRVTDDKEYKLFDRECVSRENGDAYIVKHIDTEDSVSFACMKFILRGKNLIQIESSQLGSSHEATLCDRLEKNEWPWLADRKKEWVFCPIVGGYRFEIQDPTRNGAKVCGGWKKFRMESECMKGEGIQITYPDQDCSPFGNDRSRTGDTKDDQPQGQTLTCFAGWKEDDYIFMILLAPGQSIPQYTLRFPISMTGEFFAHLYFNAVTSYDKTRGAPPAGSDIHYLELKMVVADTAACIDEGDACATFKDQGYCETYGKDCRKSCDLCDPAEDISEAKCTLPESFRKTWTLYDPLYTEDVTIGENRLTFGNRDGFVCQKKHPEKDMYKFVTTYENGCRPRYTCAQFEATNKNVLRYRISPSILREKADMEELCHFTDDDYPLKDSIRSEEYKILVVRSDSVDPVPCGLDANIPFITTPGKAKLDNTNTCKGNISDWNTQTCAVHTTLSVYPGTCQGKIKQSDFECLALISKEAEFVKLLITRRTRYPEYNCWILTTFGDDNWAEGRLLHKLPTTQCTPQTRLDVFHDYPSEASFYLYDDMATKQCAPTSSPYVVITDETGKEVWRGGTGNVHRGNLLLLVAVFLVLLVKHY